MKDSGHAHSEVLLGILKGREERAFVQHMFLRLVHGVNAAVQIALNVPGVPKRICGDDEAIMKARDLLIASLGCTPAFSSSLRNGAGVAVLLAFGGSDPVSVKTEAVRIEDGLRWGRALDIDVLTEGGAISRERLGIPHRACIICGNDAKECAKLGAHPYAELRERIAMLVREASQSPEEFSPPLSSRSDKSSR
ncbi:MAG: citrate lyase holo-[acyl-carrier protein] synthase [Synergistaceae bacterium]|nr:citrate lyase holo-[acyl-carrier protein] synthase [Synergistaceae bacterium]